MGTDGIGRRLKIAVHAPDGPRGFASRWIDHLESLDVIVKRVDCHRNDIVQCLEDCDGLMWHWSHSDPKALLMARQLIASLEAAGKVCFPDSRTCWHFDDKVGQKYLLESIGAPMARAHVFMDVRQGMDWIGGARMPVVFKLSGGAGAQNVKLVQGRREAAAVLKRMLRRGVSARDRRALLADRYRLFRRDASMRNFILLLRGVVRWVVPSRLERVKGREIGYCYFQEFMPCNDHDTRVIVIGDRAFAIRRFNRKGDFRASGSGMIDCDHTAIDPECVRIAFDVTRKLRAQCVAYDFVQDADGRPAIIEISYGFIQSVYDGCEGYWRSDMTWHPGQINPQAWMVDAMLEKIPRSDERQSVDRHRSEVKRA